MNYSELELRRSAGRMVHDHGGEAPRKARVRAEWLEKIGASSAAETWRQIATRCAELLQAVRVQ
jgi:hypothetical protein